MNAEQRLIPVTPIACSLDTTDVPARLDEWAAVLAGAERSPIDDGIRVSFASAEPLAELARLVGAERQCCSFFSFAITVDDRGLGLEVTAPADAAPLVESLFGMPI